jgi:isocitrate dehydrogenase
LGIKTNNQKAIVLAEALNTANTNFLTNDNSPSRKVGELDNRGSHFYLAMYWAQALAAQDTDLELKEVFAPLAKDLTENAADVLNELNNAQGESVDMGGYYYPDAEKTEKAMRPSQTLNKILSEF